MATWSLDKAHSELEFRIKHLMISSVKGQFDDFDIQVQGDPADITNTKVEVSIAVDSINTSNEDRDKHLRSEEFFNATAFPKITFSSTQVSDQGKSTYTLEGELHIKGKSKKIALELVKGGFAVDPWGNKKVGFRVKGEIKREDFGLTWNAALETGGVMVSNEVKFEGNIQFILT